MVSGVEHSAGGISGLQQFVEEHAEAIQFDLIGVGLRIRDIGETMSWTELRAFVNNLPPTGDSALYRFLHPNSWWWGPECDFWAAQLHSLQTANWQRGGGQGSRPKLVKRPVDPTQKQLLHGPKTVDELKQRRQATLQEIKRRQEQSRGD